jgi:hypothetical protein
MPHISQSSSTDFMYLTIEWESDQINAAVITSPLISEKLIAVRQRPDSEKLIAVRQRPDSVLLNNLSAQALSL